MLSDYDKENIGYILAGHGDWFSAKLLRLIAKADYENKEKLRREFPEHVKVYEEYVATSLHALRRLPPKPEPR